MESDVGRALSEHGSVLLGEVPEAHAVLSVLERAELRLDRVEPVSKSTRGTGKGSWLLFYAPPAHTIERYDLVPWNRDGLQKNGVSVGRAKAPDRRRSGPTSSVGQRGHGRRGRCSFVSHHGLLAPEFLVVFSPWPELQARDVTAAEHALARDHRLDRGIVVIIARDVVQARRMTAHGARHTGRMVWRETGGHPFLVREYGRAIDGCVSHEARRSGRKLVDEELAESCLGAFRRDTAPTMREIYDSLMDIDPGAVDLLTIASTHDDLRALDEHALEAFRRLGVIGRGQPEPIIRIGSFAAWLEHNHVGLSLAADG